MGQLARISCEYRNPCSKLPEDFLSAIPTVAGNFDDAAFYERALVNAAEENVAKNILDAATADSYRRVFFLGPYARRVSFSSQQNRALNLIWALQGLNKIQKGDHIAVVGAGLSGVTASAALLDLGYRVTLYEQGDDALGRQSAARHRYIHPTINRWPDEPIVETTNVPYFDWISGLCSELIGSLRAEWKILRGSKSLHFEPFATVKAFAESKAQVAVSTEKICPVNPERYRAAIVTSGFSDEAPSIAQDFPGYWQADGLEQKIMAGSKFVVSGCGDGGLIDAIRIAYKDFNDGKLTIEIAEKLNAMKWPTLNAISAAEKALADDPGKLEEAIKSGSEDLRRIYEAAVESLPSEIKHRLKSTLRMERVDLVTLVSLERTPFSPMSAPIHKLLIAYAIDQLVVSHVSGSVKTFNRDSLTYEPTGVGPGTQQLIEGHVVLRHGAGPNFRRFFEKDTKAADKLIERQKALAGDLDKPMWREGKARLKTWPPATGFAKELQQRKSQAESLVVRIVGFGGHLDLDELRGFLFFYPADRKPQNVASLPESIFGFPLFAEPYQQQKPIETDASGLEDASNSRAHRQRLAPGTSFVSALTGRLGPILFDKAGRALALTAAHVTSSAYGDKNLPILNSAGEVIGEILKSPASARLQDASFILLNRVRTIDPSYAGHPHIGAAVDAQHLFAADVKMERIDGTISNGYVSATRIPITFRLPGSSRKVVIRNAIRIRSRDPSLNFAQVGDSGAPVVDSSGNLLGIVVSTDAQFTYLLPTKRLLEDSGFELLQKQLPSTKERNDPDDAAGLFASTLQLFASANRRDQHQRPLDLDDAIAELEKSS